MAVLLATSTVTSVTPVSSESAPRTLEAQPAHVTPETANETWLALTVPAVVLLPGVLLDGDGWQPTASVRHANAANKKRMMVFLVWNRFKEDWLLAMGVLLITWLVSRKQEQVNDFPSRIPGSRVIVTEKAGRVMESRQGRGHGLWQVACGCGSF